jgi:hypothetical protein
LFSTALPGHHQIAQGRAVLPSAGQVVRASGNCSPLSRAGPGLSARQELQAQTASSAASTA